MRRVANGTRTRDPRYHKPASTKGCDACRQNSQRQKLDPVPHVCPRHDRRNEGDVSHSATDRDPQLVAVDHAGKLTSGLLPAGCKDEKIPILGEDDPLEFESPRQELIVIPVGLPILGDGQYIDLELLQAIGYRRGNMVIQVKGQAHADSPASRSFALTRPGSCRDSIKSTSLNCSRISESKCWR